MMKKSNKKGFTLVELIVVIAIMAILAAVLVPTVTSKIKDANSSAAKSDVSSLASGIQADIISIHAGTYTGLTYFQFESTPTAAPDNAAIVAALKKGTDNKINEISVGGAEDNSTITLSKAGGGDTWTVTITVATGAVSEPTK